MPRRLGDVRAPHGERSPYESSATNSFTSSSRPKEVSLGWTTGGGASRASWRAATSIDERWRRAHVAHCHWTKILQLPSTGLSPLRKVVQEAACSWPSTRRAGSGHSLRVQQDWQVGGAAIRCPRAPGRRRTCEYRSACSRGERIVLLNISAFPIRAGPCAVQRRHCARSNA